MANDALSSFCDWARNMGEASKGTCGAGMTALRAVVRRAMCCVGCPVKSIHRLTTKTPGTSLEIEGETNEPHGSGRKA